MTAETATHLAEAMKALSPLLTIIGVLLGIIVTLLVWAWKKMEHSVDKLADTITKYVEDDDTVHDTLFGLQRETDRKLNVLIGEHQVRHQ